MVRLYEVQGYRERRCVASRPAAAPAIHVRKQKCNTTSERLKTPHHRKHLLLRASFKYWQFFSWDCQMLWLRFDPNNLQVVHTTSRLDPDKHTRPLILRHR